MPVDRIVTRQPVNPGKLAQAKEMRSKMTPAEAMLWDRLRGNRLNGFHLRRQQVISGFIADFYCHSAALVIEVDGDVHDLQVEEDKERDQAFGELGLDVMRLKNEEVLSNLEDVLRRILEKCERGSRT